MVRGSRQMNGVAVIVGAPPSCARDGRNLLSSTNGTLLSAIAGGAPHENVVDVALYAARHRDKDLSPLIAPARAACLNCARACSPVAGFLEQGQSLDPVKHR